MLKRPSRIFLLFTMLASILHICALYDDHHIYQASPTEVLISFLRDLTENHKVTEADLIRFQDHLAKGELINPIQEREALASSDLYYPWATFNENLEQSTIADFDLQLLQQQVAKLIASVHKEQDERETIDIEVESVFREMHFVPVQAGTFQSRFLDKEVMIEVPFEIMDTPVAQWQWAKIMGSNPASFVEGESTRDVDMGGKKIKMQPNHPVETISYKDIEQFIAKLNEQNDGYVYALPSLAEYEAVLAQALGDTWVHSSDDDLQQYVVRGATTQIATIGTPLVVDGKRVWGLLGNVWEVTCGQQFEEDTVVFGGGLDSVKLPVSLMHVARQFDQKIMKDNVIGFRLVRSKEGANCNAQHYYLDWLNQHVEEWAKIWADDPRDFVDMQKQLKFMWEQTSDYSGPVRVTLDELHKKAVTYSDLIRLETLHLDHTPVTDITPLAGLKQLKKLNLEFTPVTDITAVGGLPQLEWLFLSYTPVTDITALSGLTQLKDLSLQHTSVADITPLAGLTQLESLWLHNIPLTDITAFAGLKLLENLDLRDTQVKDIKHLAGLKQLKKLWLRATKVSPNDVAWLKQKLPNCYIIF